MYICVYKGYNNSAGGRGRDVLGVRALNGHAPLSKNSQNSENSKKE